MDVSTLFRHETSITFIFPLFHITSKEKMMTIWVYVFDEGKKEYVGLDSVSSTEKIILQSCLYIRGKHTITFLTSKL